MLPDILNSNNLKKKMKEAFDQEITGGKLNLLHWANYAERLEEILNEIIDEVELLEKIK